MIIANLKVADAGCFAFFGLQLCNPLLAIIHRVTVLIKLVVVPCLDHAAVSNRDWRFFSNRAFNQVGDIRQGIQFGCQIIKNRRVKRF